MIYVHLLQNQQSWISCFCIAFHCSEATGATSGLPDNQPYSFEQIGIHAFALLFIAFAYLGATNWFLLIFENFNKKKCVLISFNFSAGATSGLPDNQPYSFEETGTHAFALLFIASDATDATEATSKLPDNQPYSFENTGT